MNLDPQVLKQCVERFRAERQIVAAWGLGSAFQGALRADSDVDFAILNQRNYSSDPQKEGKLLADLEDLVNRRVDLGTITTRNLIYAHEVIRRGHLLFARNPGEVDQFVGKILTLYADLRQDRKVVEEAYSA